MGAGLFRARRASATQPQPAPSPPPHPHEKRQEPQFLTRRIDYFRPRRPSHTNKRKSETPDNEAHPCDSPPHGSPKTPFSPLYGKIQGHFSVEKCPWIEISMGWIGRSMGNRNPRDGSTKGPLPAAFPTLKGGRRRTSALTVCHIAHKAVGHFRRRSRGHPVARAVALGGAAFLPPENARGIQPRRGILSPWWAVRKMSGGVLCFRMVAMCMRRG